MKKIKKYILRKLFIWLGYDRKLSRMYENGVINSMQLHKLDAIFKGYGEYRFK